LPGGFIWPSQGRNGDLSAPQSAELGSALLLPLLILSAELHKPTCPSSTSNDDYKISFELEKTQKIYSGKKNEVLLLPYIGNFLLRPPSSSAVCAAESDAIWLCDNEKVEVETNGPMLPPTMRTGLSLSEGISN